MTSRNLPAIKRIRQTRYASSDGRLWDSHVEAFKHETFLSLHALIRDRMHIWHDDAEELARALLAAEDFRIVLLGPKTPQKELT
jgi:predicted Zn-dependent peptidase